jgi:hypothetical protein
MPKYTAPPSSATAPAPITTGTIELARAALCGA